MADELDERSSHEATNAALWHKNVERRHERVHQADGYGEQDLE